MCIQSCTAFNYSKASSLLFFFFFYSLKEACIENITEFIWDNNSLMSVFVAEKSPYFSIICYLCVQDWSMGISAVHLTFWKKPSISTFHFSPGFWDLEVSRHLLCGLSCSPVWKSISIDSWIDWWFGALLVFTLWFFWLWHTRTCEFVFNFKHWNNVRLYLSDFIRICLESFAHEINKGSSFQTGLS